MENVRVRFAPSPTGLLHVGNIKIALLNYLFARKFGGKLVLRIDDTDIERSTKEYERQILEDLQWLGIEHDEFYRQSERIEKYRAVFSKLKDEGRVYPCYETKEELALKRKTQTMSGIPPVYDRAALKLTNDQRKALEDSGCKPYWRFKLNDSGVSEWQDLVHGNIQIPLNTVSDPVIVKPDGGFVYTFASVVDDADIGITHVIRGDDHVTNTATQMDIFSAICGRSPNFAHVPLMSAIDGQEVSKRTGSPLSVVNMRKDGILPEAIINVLATIGTSENPDYHDTIESLTEKFSFKKISLSSPKFNIEDIKAASKKILAEKKFDQVKDELKPVLGKHNDLSDEKMKIFWDTVKDNVNKISDADYWYCTFFTETSGTSDSVDHHFLEQMMQTLQKSEDFDGWIASLKEISGKKGRELFHPIRLVLTNLENGPELKKIANLLGRENVKMKIQRCLDAVKQKVSKRI